MTTGAEPVPVLFVMGKGRSGSTLIDNLLGQIPGVVSTGEMLYVWDWALDQGVRCGCGADVLACPMWSEVLRRGFGIEDRARDAEIIEQLIEDYRAVARYPSLPRLLLRGTRGQWSALDRYVQNTAVLYRTIAAVSGAKLIVDSSKSPLSPAALGLVTGIDGRVVHLVRDPRAVGHSWSRPKEWTDRPGGGTMPRFGALHTSASWTVRNAGAELVRSRWPKSRTIRIRYEDFVVRPRQTTEELLSLNGVETSDLPFETETIARRGTTHTVGGNPDRMNAGTVTIRSDDAWRREQPWLPRTVISGLTWPLRRRYDYPGVKFGEMTDG